MTIAIDGVRLSKKPSGVTDITISIINSLTTCYPEITLYVLTNNCLHPEVQTKLLENKNLHLWIKPIPGFKNNGLLWTLLRLNQLISVINPDLFIEPNFLFNPFLFPKKTKFATYIHDVVFKERPDTMKLISKLYMTLFLKSAFQRTDIIWTNSLYTAERLKHHYSKLLKEKFFFLGSGINPFFFKTDK